MFEKSIIVSAHPDDEILWFSSILNKVDEIVFCYLDVKSNHQWSNGRRKSLLEYPIKNISCFGIQESEVFSINNWKNPEITEYGMKISNKGNAYKKYIENYSILKQELKLKLKGFKNVFTHNPWGEYGHEEHVQVYRAVKDLEKDMKFNIWFSNYCSNKSFKLMQKYISGYDSEYITFKIDKKQANDIKNLYIKNECWTWYEDWEWFNEEFFKKDKAFTEKARECGHIFPLNMIKVELLNKSSIKDKIFNKIVYKMKRNNK